jgi:hypothetical protein
MRLLLVTLTIVLITLSSYPAQAQTAANDQYGSSGADQYGSSGAGHDAAEDALTASSAFGDAPDRPEAASVVESAGISAADSQEVVASHEVAAIKVLPETGGVSPLSLGVLLVAGGLLIRTLSR